MGDWSMKTRTGHSNPVNRHGMYNSEKPKIMLSKLDVYATVVL